MHAQCTNLWCNISHLGTPQRGQTSCKSIEQKSKQIFPRFGIWIKGSAVLSIANACEIRKSHKYQYYKTMLTVFLEYF